MPTWRVVVLGWSQTWMGRSGYPEDWDGKMGQSAGGVWWESEQEDWRERGYDTHSAWSSGMCLSSSPSQTEACRWEEYTYTHKITIKWLSVESIGCTNFVLLGYDKNISPTRTDPHIIIITIVTHTHSREKTKQLPLHYYIGQATTCSTHACKHTHEEKEIL